VFPHHSIRVRPRPPVMFSMAPDYSGSNVRFFPQRRLCSFIKLNVCCWSSLQQHDILSRRVVHTSRLSVPLAAELHAGVFACASSGPKIKVTCNFRPAAATRRPLLLCEYGGADGRKEADCRGLTLRGVQKRQRSPEVNKVALIALKYFSACGQINRID